MARVSGCCYLLFLIVSRQRLFAALRRAVARRSAAPCCPVCGCFFSLRARVRTLPPRQMPTSPDALRAAVPRAWQGRRRQRAGRCGRCECPETQRAADTRRARRPAPKGSWAAEVARAAAVSKTRGAAGGSSHKSHTPLNTSIYDSFVSQEYALAGWQGCRQGFARTRCIRVYRGRLSRGKRLYFAPHTPGAKSPPASMPP